MSVQAAAHGSRPVTRVQPQPHTGSTGEAKKSSAAASENQPSVFVPAGPRSGADGSAVGQQVDLKL